MNWWFLCFQLIIAVKDWFYIQSNVWILMSLNCDCRENSEHTDMKGLIRGTREVMVWWVFGPYRACSFNRIYQPSLHACLYLPKTFELYCQELYKTMWPICYTWFPSPCCDHACCQALQSCVAVLKCFNRFSIWYTKNNSERLETGKPGVWR